MPIATYKSMTSLRPFPLRQLTHASTSQLLFRKTRRHILATTMASFQEGIIIMALIATASKPASFAEVVTGARAPSIEQQECYLDRLPRGSLMI